MIRISRIHDEHLWFYLMSDGKSIRRWKAGAFDNNPDQSGTMYPVKDLYLAPDLETFKNTIMIYQNYTANADDFHPYGSP